MRQFTDLTKFDKFISRCLPIAALLLLVILARDAWTPGPIRLACAFLDGVFVTWAYNAAERTRK